MAQKKTQKRSKKQPAKQQAKPRTQLYSPQPLTFPPPTKCDQCGQASWKTGHSSLHDHGSWIERRRYVVCVNCNRHGVSSEEVK